MASSTLQKRKEEIAAKSRRELSEDEKKIWSDNFVKTFIYKWLKIAWPECYDMVNFPAYLTHTLNPKSPKK